MTDETRETSLAAKIAKAALSVGGKLKADKRNKEQNYNYISADKILAEAGQALAENGVAVIPATRTITVNQIDRGNGKARYDAITEMTFTVTDGATAQVQDWCGMGSDYLTPDKAMYKAITSGHRYFLAKLLCIGEGNEDGEHENGEAEKPQRQTVQPTNGKTRQQPTTPQPQQPEEPPAEWLEETAAEMGAAVKPAAIALETAESITSSDGKRYGDLDSEELSDKSAGIVMALRRTDISEERREELKMRVDAIGVILKARAAKATK